MYCTSFVTEISEFGIAMPSHGGKVFDFKVSQTGSDINPQSDASGSDVWVNPELLPTGNNL